MKRKLSMALVLFLIFGVIAACGNASKEDNATNSNANGSQNDTPVADHSPEPAAKPYAGQKLSVYLGNVIFGEAIQKLLPEFKEETGIEVEVQSFAEAQLLQKVSIQFASNSATPDVYMFRPGNDGKQFHNNGWVEPLDAYVKKDPSFDLSDFPDATLSPNTLNGELIGIPGMVTTQVVYYRKDLLQNAGLPVPATIEELIAAAKQLHDPDKGIYGFVARGDKAELVSQVSSFIYSEGGDFIVDGKAALNTPEALKAFTTYGTLLREYGPPGVANMKWPQAAGLFAQGKVAFFVDSSALFVNFNTKDKSPFADQIGYAAFPAGTAGAKPFYVAPWSIGMNSKSAHKDAAWEFIRWATSKETVLKEQQMGNAGARQSVWADPKGAEAFPPELAAAILAGGKGGVDHNLPNVTDVGPARDAIGSIVTKIMLGEDGKAEADKQNEVFQQIIDKEQGK